MNIKYFLKPKFILIYVIPLFLILFFVLRMASVFRSLSFFKNSIFEMLVTKRNYSYNQRMLDIFGFQYTYFLHITKTVPENAIIYFPILPYGGVVKRDALYFLYPRQVKNKNFNIDRIVPKEGIYEVYVALINDFPDFSINSEKIIIFGDSFEDKDVSLNIDEFNPANFKGSYGLIKIKQ